jgi:serine protease AprX
LHAFKQAIKMRLSQLLTGCDTNTKRQSASLGKHMKKRQNEFTVMIERRAAKALLTPFTVMIERRALLRKTVSSLVATAMAMTALTSAPLASAAQPAKVKGERGHQKFARDLQDAVDGKDVSPRSMKALRPGQVDEAHERAKKRHWSRDEGGARHVQVIFVSNAEDADMADLKAAIKQAGGVVNNTMPGLRMITATLNAKRVASVADRADVEYVAPNRPTFTTSSELELATGAVSNSGRTNSTQVTYTGMDGTGVGIAVLDSGVMKTHKAFSNASGTSRVLRNVSMLNTSMANAMDASTTVEMPGPNTAARTTYENQVANDDVVIQDAWGHGTHVAAIAAGRAAFYTSAPDTTGIAPNASIIDVKVLNNEGVGTIADTLEGIQWVIYHAKDYNIRVMNLSLAANSTDTWQKDPLCVAVRSATAAGITVVAAAGNFGLVKGPNTYGTVLSPANDPSVITVGSSNHRGSRTRTDDSVNLFSSIGPTRSSSINDKGEREFDNHLKPDLVAPGNRILGAAATSATATNPEWNGMALRNYEYLTKGLTFTQAYRETHMYMSGTSVSAPIVSGAAALILQANPGLTPPMVKAVLQYTAQPMPNANLLQQGAGQLNIAGALTLVKTMRTDVASSIAAGRMSSGTTLQTPTMRLTTTRSSNFSGESLAWSRMVFVGGNRIVSGDALFTKFQPFYDPKITWAKSVVLKREPTFWDINKSYVKRFTETRLTNTKLLTAGVVDGTGLLGAHSLTNKTGLFMPSKSLADLFIAGSGFVLAEGLVLAEGFVLAEGLVLAEGVVMSEGIVMSEGYVLAEGLVMNEAFKGE